MHAGHAGHPRARRPAIIPSSDLPGELPRLVITRGGQGLRPAPAGPGRLRYGDGLRKPGRGNAILAAAAWRCRLIILSAPSARGVV
jgi:hypothetical protein